ncbi:MAG: peptidase U32 family protein [Thermoguttaceae bacterium]|jgi:putative protease
MKIMAPAGDSDRLDAALKAGADEVYMGLVGFGARRFAGNFAVDEYCAAIDKAHLANVSVHLTFNTVLSDAEFEEAYPDLKKLYEAGLDSVILQDFGAISWFKERFPALKLCASTQLSPANSFEVDWYEEQGFSRVVLARELTLNEIRAIREKTRLELEVFVSGALCLGLSGKCYLSSFIGGRSGNRGMCAQPCRQYYCAERLDGDQVSSGQRYGYFLSLRDQLQGREELQQLVDMGIASVKIEGRMKSPAYVYETVRYYRELVDMILDVSPKITSKRLSIKSSGLESTPPRGADLVRQKVVGKGSETARREDVAALFNRGYDRGYLYEHDPDIVNEFYSSNFGVEIGRVRRDAVRLTRPLRNGDGVVFLDETAHKLGGFNASGIRLLDPMNARRSKIVDAAEPGDLVQFHEPVPSGATLLYRTFDYRLNKEIESALRQTRRREPASARLVARVGEPMELTLTTQRATASVRAQQDVEAARKKGVDRESLLESLDRFGASPFYLDQTCLDFDQNAFIPKSLLNQLRQEATAKLSQAILDSYRRIAPALPAADDDESESSMIARAVNTRVRTDSTAPYLAAVARTREQYDACKALGVTKIYYETRPVNIEGRFRFHRSEYFSPIAGSLVEALRLEERGVPYALSWYFNVANARAAIYLADRFPLANVLYLSPEISDRAIDALVQKLDGYQDRRDFELGLPVYGRLLAMYTQKTLFDSPRMQITNANDRRLIVERNAGLHTGFSDEYTAAFAPTDSDVSRVEAPTGSSLYLNEPLDLLDAIPQILDSGIDEILLTFTTETRDEVRQVVERALSTTLPPKIRTFSYGYARDGIF